MTTRPLTSPQHVGEFYREKIYLLLAALAVVRLWIMPMTASFWLDETVTYWSVCKGVAASISRSQFWPGQNLPYTLVAALTFRLVGSSEVALRLPSLLAALGTAWLLFRFATRLFDRETGLLAVIVFASLHEMSLTAANARQYSLGLLFVVGSVLQLAAWLDSGRKRNLLGFVLLAAAIPYFQYLFATVYAVHAVYALYRLRRGSAVRWPKIVLAVALVLVLLSPLMWNAVNVKHQSVESLSFLYTPHFGDLITALMPPALGAGIFAGLLLGYAFCRNPNVAGIRTSPETSVLLLSWLTIPIATLFFVSRVTPVKVFLSRYYLPAFPALALLVAWGLRSLVPEKARLYVSSCIVIAAIASFGSRHLLPVNPHQEDWRAAAQAVRDAGVDEKTLVLFRAGLAETKVVPGVDIDPDSPFLCPLSKYPIPGRIILAPYHLDDDGVRYMKDVSSNILEPAGQFVFMTRDDDQSLKPWLLGRFSDKGFVVSKIGRADGVSAMWFRRRP